MMRLPGPRSGGVPGSVAHAPLLQVPEQHSLSFEHASLFCFIVHAPGVASTLPLPDELEEPKPHAVSVRRQPTNHRSKVMSAPSVKGSWCVAASTACLDAPSVAGGASCTILL